MSIATKVTFALACLTLIAAAPADAHDHYGRPYGYAPYQPHGYVYQPPIVHRPPPAYYRPWPAFEPEYYWRRHHHGRGW